MNKDAFIALMNEGKLDFRAEFNKRSDERIWEIVLRELGGHYVLARASSGGGAGSGDFPLQRTVSEIDKATERLKEVKIVEGYCRYDELENLGEPEINRTYLALIRSETETKQREFFSKAGLVVDFNYWLRLPYWSVEEGVAVIHGLDLNKIYAHDKRNYQNFSQKSQYPIIRSYNEWSEIARRSANHGVLNHRNTPSEFLGWADSAGYPLPESLQELAIEKKTNTTRAIDVVQSTAAMAVIEPKEWKDNARKIGKDVLSSYPLHNIEQISQKVHRCMQERKDAGELGMTGRGGKVPKAETIKRHALTGLKT